MSRRPIAFPLAFLLILACDQAAEPDPPRPATVTVTPPAAELTALGATVRLSASVRDQNGQPMPSAAVTWTSGAPAVAAVDGSGVVTAVANGTAAITAMAGTVSARAMVTVAQVVESVAVTPSEYTLVEVDTVRLSAAAADANGHPVAGTAFEWASADTLVAVVDASGLVTGVAAGAVVIEASTVAGGPGQAEVEVVEPVATAVTVTPDTVAFAALGDTAGLSAAVFDQAGRPMKGVTVTWASGDTAVVVVDAAGAVVAVGEGESVTTADAGGATASAVVKVRQVARSVRVTPAADTVELGDTLRLAAEAFDANGYRILRLAVFGWTSSDTAVAVVDASGLVVGRGEGRASITASADEVSAVAEIAVEHPDRAALVALYHATRGPNWHRNDYWVTGAPLADWFGVSLNEDGRVSELSFERYTPPWPLPIYDNGLAGELPPELGNLTALELLHLADDGLTGEIPPELGNLTALKALSLGNRLTGRIPVDLANLSALEELVLYGSVCAPDDPDVQRWLGRIGDHNVPSCPPYSPARAAHLVQSIQTLDGSVPLVAGRYATLRVFLTAPPWESIPVPSFRVSFYDGGQLVYSKEIRPGNIPGSPQVREVGSLPSEIDPRGGNPVAVAFVPGHVVRRGMEMVVEAELDPALGIGGRIPATGRIVLNVHALPTMELTIVPFLNAERTPWRDSINAAYIATVKDMAANPYHEVMREPRVLLPANDWAVTAHEPVWYSKSMGSYHQLRALRALRAMEGGRGYWMGTSPGSALLSEGVTILSALEGSTIAHELGHSMGLGHAFCAAEDGVDPAAPALIGVWGFWLEFLKDIHPNTPALMSYCTSRCYWHLQDKTPGHSNCPRRWISPYHFRKALYARRQEPWAMAAFRTPTSALVLWGGDSESGGLHLEPAFVVDAAPMLPDSAGGYTLAGRNASGRELFSLTFAMPEIADAGEAVRSFVYTLPVRPGWEALASVTLTAPDGRTAVLDGSTDRPMTILRDARTGQVRAFLDGLFDSGPGGRGGLVAELGAIAMTSRGIPVAAAWRR